jgi:hypothetical protein
MLPRLALGRADEYHMSETRLRSEETPTEGKVQAPFCRKSSQVASADQRHPAVRPASKPR